MNLNHFLTQYLWLRSLLSCLQKLHNHAADIVGLYGTIALLFLSLFGGWITPHEIEQTYQRFHPPAWATNGDISYFFGTNQKGEDLLSQLILGIHSTVGLSLLTVIFVFLIGGLLGFWFALVPSIKSKICSRIYNIIPKFPSLFLIILFLWFFPPSLPLTLFALFLALIPRFIRTTYQLVSNENNKDYILAVRLDGASRRFILWHEILPNILPQLVSETTFIFSLAIIELSLFGFFDLLPNSIENNWGSMLKQASQFMDLSLLPLVYPGIAMIVSILFIYLLGQGINRTLEVENR